MLSNFYSKHGDDILDEPILGECRNKADMSAFFYILTKTFVEDLVLNLTNFIESILITQPAQTLLQSSLSLKALTENEVFLIKVMVPLVEKRAKEENCDFEKDSIIDLVQKKVTSEKRRWEARLLEAASKEIKGVLAALTKALIVDKDINADDENMMDNMLDDLRDRGRGP